MEFSVLDRISKMNEYELNWTLVLTGSYLEKIQPNFKTRFEHFF